jgi:hypothetical protein
MQHIKGPTAVAANRILGRSGQPFWQTEYFDREIKNHDEFSRSKRYIEQNPVSAELVANAEDFEWSSAWSQTRLGPRKLSHVVASVA